MTIRSYIQAARLRTLPLSSSGVLVGAAGASMMGQFKISIFLLALMTTLLLQTLSNYANDYGDGVKGTDENREGEARMTASGAISAQNILNAIKILALLSFLSGLALILTSFGLDQLTEIIIFLTLGITSIIASIKYTIGNNAYGYKGQGDIAVFLFFGVLSAFGTNYLMTQNLFLPLILPALTVGFWSMAVLNLNNMRDEKTDKIYNKRTVVVRMGGRRAKIYHYILITLGILSAVIYAGYYDMSKFAWVVIFPCIVVLRHLFIVYRISEPKKLDSQLKVVALSTFFYALSLVLVQQI